MPWQGRKVLPFDLDDDNGEDRPQEDLNHIDVHRESPQLIPVRGITRDETVPLIKGTR